jgi:hypothetical protein
MKFQARPVHLVLDERTPAVAAALARAADQLEAAVESLRVAVAGGQ